MNLLPSLWGKKEEKAVVPAKKDGTIIVQPKTAVAPRSGGALIQARSKPIKIGETIYDIDPQELIRMIRRVTQDIGAYKNFDGPYAAIILGSLRKARGDMVSLLEHHFHISWSINEQTNKSEFHLT
jgi:hypothetical protein